MAPRPPRNDRFEDPRLPALITWYKDFTPAARAAYLAELARSGNPIQAAAAVRVRPKMIRQWAKDDPELAEDIAEAWADFTEGTLLPEAHRRAVDGTAKGVYYRGARAKEADGSDAVIVDYSDVLLIRLLERRDPSFRPHHVVEATNKGPALPDLEQLSPAARAHLEAFLRQRALESAKAPALQQPAADLPTQSAPAPVPLPVELEPETDS